MILFPNSLFACVALYTVVYRSFHTVHKVCSKLFVSQVLAFNRKLLISKANVEYLDWCLNLSSGLVMGYISVRPSQKDKERIWIWLYPWLFDQPLNSFVGEQGFRCAVTIHQSSFNYRKPLCSTVRRDSLHCHNYYQAPEFIHLISLLIYWNIVRLM